MSETNAETRFLLSTEVRSWDPSGLEIKAHPIRMEDGKVRNISTCSYEPEPLADFVVSAVCSRDVTLGTASDGTYAWSRGYVSVFSVDTARAEVMVKLLRTLDRKMVKLESELGLANDFATYLTRVGFALGIKQYGWLVAQGSGYSHDDNTYQWHDGSWVADWVRGKVAEHRGAEVRS